MPLRTRGGKLTKLGHFEQEVTGSSLPGGGKPSAAGRRAAEAAGRPPTPVAVRHKTGATGAQLAPDEPPRPSQQARPAYRQGPRRRGQCSQLLSRRPVSSARPARSREVVRGRMPEVQR